MTRPPKSRMQISQSAATPSRAGRGQHAPDKRAAYEAAILAVVPGRRFSASQTPAQRQVQLKIWAEHDAHRRRTNTMFMFWKACPGRACRCAKSCAGDPHACFARCWPQVPANFKASLRGTLAALSNGASLEDALRAGSEVAARHDELAKAEAQSDRDTADIAPDSIAPDCVAPSCAAPTGGMPERPLARVRIVR
jgi:hypothetical protein